MKFLKVIAIILLLVTCIWIFSGAKVLDGILNFRSKGNGLCDPVMS